MRRRKNAVIIPSCASKSSRRGGDVLIHGSEGQTTDAQSAKGREAPSGRPDDGKKELELLHASCGFMNGGHIL